MIVALTVRKLKPGSVEDFKTAFLPGEDFEPPAGLKRFYALQNVDDKDEVITFGFFDGTVEELREGQGGAGYDERRGRGDEFVESVGADGVYEVIQDRSME